MCGFIVIQSSYLLALSIIKYDPEFHYFTSNMLPQHERFARQGLEFNTAWFLIYLLLHTVSPPSTDFLIWFFITVSAVKRLMCLWFPGSDLLCFILASSCDIHFQQPINLQVRKYSPRSCVSAGACNIITMQE